MPLAHATCFSWCCLPGKGGGRAKRSNRNHPCQPAVTAPGDLPPGVLGQRSQKETSPGSKGQPDGKEHATSKRQPRQTEEYCSGHSHPAVPHRAAGNAQRRSKAAATLLGPLSPGWVYFSTASVLQDTS